MEKHIVHRDPFDVFAPFIDLGRRWDEIWGRRENAGQMITPAVDIHETEDAIVVHAELPGMKKGDVKITIEDGVLSISGEKKFEKEEKQKDFHRVERRYGSFHRSFTLPSGIDPDAAQAKFEDGVLTIMLPKSAAAKPRTLEIR